MRSVPFLALVVCLAVVLVPAGLARGEIVYVEDFENDGEPGFDPMFVHEIGPSPYSTAPASWDLTNDSAYPAHGTVLGLWPAQDCVQFDLLEGEEIFYASVDVRIWDNPYNSDRYSIDFIGQQSSHRVFLAHTTQYVTIDMGSAEIGPITEIRMRALEGYFDNITIHVVPEPSMMAIGATAIVVWCAAFGLRRRRRPV